MTSMETVMTLDKNVLPELRHETLKFIEQTRWTMPCIFSGHPVAHRDPSAKIKNFSTITKIVAASDERQYFLVYRYPLSWIHSITDNVQRWSSGRPSSKPFTVETWQKRFEKKSHIGLLDLKIQGLVVMEYIPNLNLWDVLHNNAGALSHNQILDSLKWVAEDVNRMHANDKTWGELIVNNVILRDKTLRPVICDTEVDYWQRTGEDSRKAHDWRDLIFSACGSYTTTIERKKALAGDLFKRIEDRSTQRKLVEMCRKRRHLGQVICWQGMGGALSCSWSDYTLIRKAIVYTWETM